MANAKIQLVGPDEFPLICDLYSEIFRPPEDASFFERRLHNREALILVAELERRPVGFAVGYELRPSTYYSWLVGVLPEARRMGIGSQLVSAEHAWAREHGFEMVRTECYNQQRAMLVLAIRAGYDVVGIRYDSRTANNLIIFEKSLSESGE